jgi:hypothetical protein
VVCVVLIGYSQLGGGTTVDNMEDGPTPEKTQGADARRPEGVASLERYWIARRSRRSVRSRSPGSESAVRPIAFRTGIAPSREL